MAYYTESDEAFYACDLSKSGWTDPEGEEVYMCKDSCIVAYNTEDLGCYECMLEKLKEQQQYHDDITAAWNAAKGIH